jgi:hypothetical protein
MKGSKKRALPKETFREAISTCPPLRLREGLQAIKKSEGKGQISAANLEQLLGSVAIDDDCLSEHPNASRWDYLVGYDRNGQAIAHFIEVHYAETSDVSVVEKKFDWLQTYLGSAGHEQLKSLPAEYHWVASGRVNIPQHLPQYKKLQTTLRKRGLRFPVKVLVLD